MDKHNKDNKTLCPRCKQMFCNSQYDPDNNEGFILCIGCGYFKGMFIERNEKGEIIYEWKWFSKKPKWKNVEVKDAFAAYIIIEGDQYYSGYLATEKDYEELVEGLKKDLTIKDNQILYFGINQLIKGRIVRISIYNKNIPIILN